MPTNTIAIEKMPVTLREAIARSRLSNEQIAAKIGCTRKSLSNWRQGKRPSDYFIGRLSEVLNIDLWPMFTGNATPHIPDKEAEHKAIIPTTMPATISTLSLAGWQEHEVLNQRSHQSIDSAMKSFLNNQLAGLWTTFHTASETSSNSTLQIALSSHMQLVRSLIAWPIAEKERRDLFQSLSDATILASRIARDQMNFELALKYHHEALELAQLSKSPNHISAAIMRLIETLFEAGMPYEALSYCQAAIAQSKHANPRIRGEVFGLVAQIYAITGESLESERLIDLASTLAIGATQLPTAGGINFSQTAAASYQTAEALRRGDVHAALQHITRAQQLVVTEFPVGQHVRLESHLWIEKAQVHRAAREIETACEDLRRAANLAQQISSRIALRKIQEVLSQVFQEYRTLPSLIELRDELMIIVRK